MRRVRKQLVAGAAALAVVTIKAGVSKADISLFTTQADFAVGTVLGNGWFASDGSGTGTLVDGAAGDTDGSTINGVGNYFGSTYAGGQTSAAGAMTVTNFAGGTTNGVSSNFCPFNSEDEASSNTTTSPTTYNVNTAFFNALGIDPSHPQENQNAETISYYGTMAVDFTLPVNPTTTGTFFQTQFIFNDSYDGYNQLGLTNARQPAQGGSDSRTTGYTVQTGPNSYTMYQNWSLPYGVPTNTGDSTGNQIEYNYFQVIMNFNTDYAGGSVTFDNIRTTNAYAVWNGSGSGNANFSNASFWSQTPLFTLGGTAVNPYSTGGNLVAGDRIVFSGYALASQTVNNDTAAGTAYEGIVFDDTQVDGTTAIPVTETAYTLTGNSINLTGDIVNDSTTTQAINVPLVLEQNTNVDLVNGSLNIGGNISGNGFGLNIPTQTFNTALALSGVNTYGGDTTVASGMTLNINANGSLSPNTTLIANGIVNVAASTTSGILQRSVQGIALASGGQVLLANPSSHSNRTLLTTSALTFGGTANAPQGLLDLSGNDMIIHDGNLAAVFAAIARGYNGGNWVGTGGLTSSAAAATSNTALGIELNSNGSGGTQVSTFDGQAVSSTDVLVKYTYFGDANLDGVVNGSDYTLIDNGFNNSLTGWHNGDFNYDGIVNGDDYTLIDNAFNTQGASLAAASAETGSATAQISSVPEPVSAATLAVLAMGYMSRRKRARRTLH